MGLGIKHRRTCIDFCNIVSSVATDAIDCVFLGVVTQLVGLWFNSKPLGKIGTMQIVR